MALVNISPTNSNYRVNGAPEIYTFMDAQHQNWCLQKLVDHHRNKAYTDIIIQTQDGVEIPCHKIILSASCPYFHRMFGSGMKESFSNYIVLKGIKSSVADIIIEYLYSFRIELTVDNVQDITEACVQLELDRLEEACDGFMADHLDPSNCFGLLMFAKMYHLPKTLKSAMTCVNKKLPDILKQAPDHEYKLLTGVILQDIIASDNLLVEDEAYVFQLVVRWIGMDFKHRWREVDKVMQLVRFPFCSPEYLSNVVKNHHYFGSKRCQEILGEALQYQACPTDNASSLRMKPRKPLTQLIVVGAEENDSVACWYLRDGEEEWHLFSSLPTENHHNYQICDVGSDIWLSGGYHKQDETTEISKECWCFSSSDMKWKPMPDMLEPRCQHNMVSVQGQQYALGGWGGTHYLKSVERFDPKSNSWVSMAPMSTCMCNFLAVPFDNKIYAFDCLLDSAQVYNTDKDEWQVLPDLPGKCDRGSIAVHEGDIYLFSDIKTMMYSPKMNSWVILTKPPHTRFNHTAAFWQDKLILAGGQQVSTNTEPCAEVSEYDPKIDQWSTGQLTLPKPMSGHKMMCMKAFKRNITDPNNN